MTWNECHKILIDHSEYGEDISHESWNWYSLEKVKTPIESSFSVAVASIVSQMRKAYEEHKILTRVKLMECSTELDAKIFIQMLNNNFPQFGKFYYEANTVFFDAFDKSSLPYLQGVAAGYNLKGVTP